MATFEEGQQVEVSCVMQEAYAGFKERRRWRKALILRQIGVSEMFKPLKFFVEFHDGTRSVFDADHIRPAQS